MPGGPLNRPDQKRVGPKGRDAQGTGTDAGPQLPAERLGQPIASVSGPKVLEPTIGGIEKWQPVDFAAVHGSGIAERSAGKSTPPAEEMHPRD